MHASVCWSPRVLLKSGKESNKEPDLGYPFFRRFLSVGLDHVIRRLLTGSSTVHRTWRKLPSPLSNVQHGQSIATPKIVWPVSTPPSSHPTPLPNLRSILLATVFGLLAIIYLPLMSRFFSLFTKSSQPLIQYLGPPTTPTAQAAQQALQSSNAMSGHEYATVATVASGAPRRSTARPTRTGRACSIARSASSAARSRARTLPTRRSAPVAPVTPRRLRSSMTLPRCRMRS